MSPSYAYIVDEGGASSSSPMHAQMPLPSEEDLEDDHICPVCEGECTCAPAPLLTSPSGYTTPPVATRVTESVPSVPKHPSLKIRLTLPSSLSHNRTSSSKDADGKLASSSKKKSKSRGETTLGGGNIGGQEGIGSPFTAIGQPLIHLNADGSFPKKRGRPTKAVVAARKAAQNQSTTSEALGRGKGVFVENAGAAMRESPHTSAYIRKPMAQLKKTKKLSGAAAASRATARSRRTTDGGVLAKAHMGRKRASKSTIRQSESSSELSDIDVQDEGNPQSIRYPTFIPALSSSSNNTSASELSSDSSDSNSSSESEKEKEPEREMSPRQKLREELGLASVDGEGSNQRKWSHHNNWELRPRKSSVSADGTSDVANNSDEETEGEDEAEGEADEDADGEADVNDEDDIAPGVRRRLMRYAGVATGWTDDDEESSFDADIFFANLSGSSESESGSDDEDNQLGDAEVGFGEEDGDGQDEEEMDFGVLDMQLGLGMGGDAFALSEIAAAGFLAPFTDLDRDQNLPLTHGWDSLLGSNFKDALGIPDLGLDVNVTGPSIDISSIPGLAEADIMMATSEEEEAVAMFDIDEDPFSPSQQDADFEDEDGVEIFEDSDEGETTEDEYIEVDGIQTPRNLVLLRFPASLGAIDPMSTVNIPTARGRLLLHSPNGRKSPRANGVGKKNTDVHDKRTATSSPDNKENEDADFKHVSPPAPVMGSFARELFDKTKKVVITQAGSTSCGKVPPSPFPAIRRIRRGSSIRSGVSAHFISVMFVGLIIFELFLQSDRGSNGSRPSSFLAKRSPYQALVSGDFDSGEADDLPPAEPIRLDDVLDSAFLEAEPPSSQVPDSAASETGDNESDGEHHKHLENLHRWDRIPIDTFRKTRSAGAAVDLVPADKTVIQPLRRAPRPADGFSYGSAAGGMLRGSPLSATLWDSDSSAANAAIVKQQKSTRRSGRMSVIISPVILPVRDADRTPTNDHHQLLQQQAYLGYTGAHKIHHAFNHAQVSKSRKELRKEKKRNRKFFGSPAQNIRRNHFPNAKSRSTSSMQRSHFSSSVPPLSI